ncbi:hypothetical protein AA14337_3360 [Acetobacter malorum DSM 14337]|uniref:Uncharacterized protein n=1 Tax=Acetobacter malorum DSM 14337 TaxID=1307910 RepID=A0ABQ0Q152_9PROT|nr:hypothetical protein [Acetobacter malorum]KXV06506.1 hypothetical protein AD930_07865 [Acetobacter malorum]GBQ86578.1 hypothetical protein AA14337_3360 [Acetobacter malorum DSM 14337]
MSDVFASALEGQAIAGLITNLKGKIASVRSSRELESLVLQMQAAYEKRIELLKDSSRLLQNSCENYKLTIEDYKTAVEGFKGSADKYRVAAENNKKIAENNFIKGTQYKNDLEKERRILEAERAANTAMKAELLQALSEGVVYKAVAFAARQALSSEPGVQERTSASYKQTVVREIRKGLELIKTNNGDEMYGFALKYIKWAANQSYLLDVSDELHKSFTYISQEGQNPSPQKIPAPSNF